MITHPSFFFTHITMACQIQPHMFIVLLKICCHGDVILSSFLGENDLSSKYKQWVWNRDLWFVFFVFLVPFLSVGFILFGKKTPVLS